MNNFKEEELIMYLYNDCPSALSAAINKAIQDDTDLKNRLETLKRSMEQMDKVKLHAPSEETIKAIMEYAAKSVKNKKDS
jgi:hypothetical protein